MAVTKNKKKKKLSAAPSTPHPIRFPDSLWEAIGKMADENRRTINETILMTMESTVQKHNKSA